MMLSLTGLKVSLKIDICQNSQQKTFSAKRLSKNDQKKQTANPKIVRPNFTNLAAKWPICQPWA